MRYIVMKSIRYTLWVMAVIFAALAVILFINSNVNTEYGTIANLPMFICAVACAVVFAVIVVGEQIILAIMKIQMPEPVSYKKLACAILKEMELNNENKKEDDMQNDKKGREYTD